MFSLDFMNSGACNLFLLCKTSELIVLLTWNSILGILFYRRRKLTKIQSRMLFWSTFRKNFIRIFFFFFPQLKLTKKTYSAWPSFHYSFENNDADYRFYRVCQANIGRTLNHSAFVCVSWFSFLLQLSICMSRTWSLDCWLWKVYSPLPRLFYYIAHLVRALWLVNFAGCILLKGPLR